MIAALWSNSAWDEDKSNPRQRVVNSINADYDETIEAIEKAFSNVHIPESEKLTDDNPFFAATERGLQKVDRRIKELKGQNDDEPESEFDTEPEVEEIDYMKGLDQQE
jgi:hypothetical protein